MEGLEGGRYLLKDYLRAQEAECGEDEAGTGDHRILARKREEPQPKQVMIGHLGRDVSLEACQYW